MHSSLSANSLSSDYEVTEGRVGWQSPSNIALVKYWGKRANQIPENPSISLTLTNSYTNTYCSFKNNNDGLKVKFFFEGKENIQFGARIEKWLASLIPTFPFLGNMDLVFESENSFPHSAGIASSASAMSAIALCICEIERIMGTHVVDFYQRASHIARLGSGSACRSIYSTAALWGAIEAGHDEYAVPMKDKIDPVFHTFQDAILIVDQKPKSVSSSLGHQLMENNPFARPRYQRANENMTEIFSAMAGGDLEKMGTIIEEEALSLHAMMMLSNYLLLKPGSLAIIEKVRKIRNSEKWPLYFTIDAGPNIHLLYPQGITRQVKDFIEIELKQHCSEERIIYDMVGNGPVNLIT
ncbi:MAG: diphosphomevalonate decarboxylase [Bacteroidia bacterium]|nr:diphosphomevalonate decarboxylase [Bacteroidia bacterium]